MRRLVFTAVFFFFLLYSFQSLATRFNLPADRDIFEGKAEPKKVFKASKSSIFLPCMQTDFR